MNWQAFISRDHFDSYWWNIESISLNFITYEYKNIPYVTFIKYISHFSSILRQNIIAPTNAFSQKICRLFEGIFLWCNFYMYEVKTSHEILVFLAVWFSLTEIFLLTFPDIPIIYRIFLGQGVYCVIYLRSVLNSSVYTQCVYRFYWPMKKWMGFEMILCIFQAMKYDVINAFGILFSKSLSFFSKLLF